MQEHQRLRIASLSRHQSWTATQVFHTKTTARLRAHTSLNQHRTSHPLALQSAASDSCLTSSCEGSNMHKHKLLTVIVAPAMNCVPSMPQFWVPHRTSVHSFSARLALEHLPTSLLGGADCRRPSPSRSFHTQANTGSTSLASAGTFLDRPDHPASALYTTVQHPTFL